MRLYSSEEHRKENLARYKNALSKLEPHQTDEKILLFSLAARREFGKSEIIKKLIEELGTEKLAEMDLDEFIKIIENEVKGLPEEFMCLLHSSR